MEIGVSVNELLPRLQILSRADKLRLVFFLTSQLAQGYRFIKSCRK
jgi:hypothetical protein